MMAILQCIITGEQSLRLSDYDTEMLQAADSVGRAMSDFVTRAVKPL